MENLTFTFGKFKDVSIKDVFEKQPSYIEWILKQSWFKEKFTKEYQMCICLSKMDNNELPFSDTDIIIYTDGACSKNGSMSAKAGIGVHFSKRNKIKFNDISAAFPDNHSVQNTGHKVTNQRAELQAIVEALRITKEYPHKIIIYTDSEYSINCVTKWFPTWVKKNKLEDKKNIDLIRPIYQYYNAKNIVFRHINSHTGLQDEHSLGNEEADRLATNSISN
jgi:ribonuclease HI